MVTSQWLLARAAVSESRIYQCIAFGEKQFVMLAYAAKQRAQLERAFRTAIEDMKRSQKERRQQPAQRQQPSAQPTQAAQPPAHQSAEPHTPPPGYVMSEGAEAHPVSCSPVTPDSR